MSQVKQQNPDQRIHRADAGLEPASRDFFPTQERETHTSCNELATAVPDLQSGFSLMYRNRDNFLGYSFYGERSTKQYFAWSGGCLEAAVESLGNQALKAKNL